MAIVKILMVDDDDDLAYAMRLPLEAAGYQVFRARDGEQALKQVQTVNPDLILMDVMMDTTTAGFQVSLALRSPDPASPYAAYRSIPILMLTAIHSTTPLRFGPDANFLPVDAFVEKPIAPDALLALVREHLARRAS